MLANSGSLIPGYFLPDHILQRVNPRIEAQLIPGPLSYGRLSNLESCAISNTMDQGSVGDCGLFRYRQFERVSEIPGIPATHTVPTLFPNQ